MLVSVSIAIALAMQPAAIPASEDNQIVCKKQAKTGTRHQTKTCRTKLQWEQIRIQSQRELKEMMDRPQIETRRGG